MCVFRCMKGERSPMKPTRRSTRIARATVQPIKGNGTASINTATDKTKKATKRSQPNPKRRRKPSSIPMLNISQRKGYNRWTQSVSSESHCTFQKRFVPHRLNRWFHCIHDTGSIVSNCPTLHYTALHYTTLHCIASHHIALYDTVFYRPIPFLPVSCIVVGW